MQDRKYLQRLYKITGSSPPTKKLGLKKNWHLQISPLLRRPRRNAVGLLFDLLILLSPEQGKLSRLHFLWVWFPLLLALLICTLVMFLMNFLLLVKILELKIHFPPHPWHVPYTSPLPLSLSLPHLSWIFPPLLSHFLRQGLPPCTIKLDLGLSNN